jgi:Fic family protein
MKEKVYTFDFSLNWKVLRAISKIDRFDASWASIEKIEGKSLKQLKSVATIQSVGASTRIEGSKLTDEDVEELLSKIDISKIEDRDSQEVVGYFNVLDLISESFSDIGIQESSIKNLHNLLLTFSEKDVWHRGDYKQHTNAVQATFPDGTKQVIFKTTDPGFPTEIAMKSLIEWYADENEVHPLISSAAFIYDFLSIHPFQDGNGRLSRLLTTLLLLKSGYKWIEYVSFEHEIENNKKTYYQVLRSCQAQRPNEDITVWIDFFLESLINLQNKLQNKLEISGLEGNLSPKEKEVLTFIGNNAGSKSGEISRKLNITKPTVKRLLADLIEKGLIIKHGKGAGTNYSIK